MILHTLIYSFPPEMTSEDRERFFAEIEEIMTGQGGAESAGHRDHHPIDGDPNAPVFVAAAIEQACFPDLDALAATSALPAMHEFIARWQGRFPHTVVWANHEPF